MITVANWDIVCFAAKIDAILLLIEFQSMRQF